MVKAMALSAVLTGMVALILGSQGTSAGPLAVYALDLGDYQMFWSWPIFAAGSLLGWGLSLLQR